MPARDATVVLVAHGSRVAEANEAHRRLAVELAERTGRRVLAAFLELAEPDIPTALDEAAAVGHEVLVLPHFLLPGAHTNVDIPGIVDAARGRHPGTRFEQLPHLGADPARTFVIEDSVHGITGARRAGMRVIGFTGAAHSYPGHADALTEAGAETVIRRWAELKGVIAALSEWSQDA